MHGKKDWDGSNDLQFTETLTESTVSQWNSSGIFSQDSASPMPISFLKMQKDLEQDVVHSSDLDLKQSGVPPTMKDLEENGTKSLN